MAGPWEKYQQAAPTDGPWAKYGSAPSQPAAEPISTGERFVKGLRDPIDAGAQLITNLLPQGVVNAGNRLNNIIADRTGLVARLPEGGVDQQVREAERQYQARRAASGGSGFDAARLAGNIINPVNLTVGSALPRAATVAGRVGLGAVGGALSGALTPVADGDFATEKAKQVGAAALVGGAIPAVAAGIGRVISPNASRNAELQLLKDAGVRPTVGQALGGRASRWEEMAMSAPVVGDSIANARRRAMDDFNKAAIARATGKVGAQVDDIGQQGVKQAGDAISDAYDDALNQITGVRLDGTFNRDLMQLRGMAEGLTSDLKRKFNKTVQETIVRKGRTGSILPDDYKAVDSELGKLASDYRGSSTASEREFGDAVLQLQALLKQQMLRSNPQVADRLREADAAWANLVRVEGASKAAKNNGGVFTPAQLNQAIQGADKSVRKRAVARGTALMQDLSNAGQNVLGNRYPDSGTAGRMLLNGGALAGGSLVSPGALLGLGAGYAAYLSPAQQALVAAVSARPQSAQAVSQALQNASPFALGASGQLGLGLLGE